jgi:hypothetical protein
MHSLLELICLSLFNALGVLKIKFCCELPYLADVLVECVCNLLAALPKQGHRERRMEYEGVMFEDPVLFRA